MSTQSSIQPQVETKSTNALFTNTAKCGMLSSADAKKLPDAHMESKHD